jgi:hypothetical protein
MEEEIDDWRIRELEDAWEMLSEEQKAECQHKSEQRRLESDRRKLDYISLTPEELEQVRRDLTNAFDAHNTQMRELLEKFVHA